MLLEESAVAPESPRLAAPGSRSRAAFSLGLCGLALLPGFPGEQVGDVFYCVAFSPNRIYVGTRIQRRVCVSAGEWVRTPHPFVSVWATNKLCLSHSAPTCVAFFS